VRIAATRTISAFAETNSELRYGPPLDAATLRTTSLCPEPNAAQSIIEVKRLGT
jgi:hypothetical protein